MDRVQMLENLVSDGKITEALDCIEALPQEDRNRWQIQNLTGMICSYCGQFKEAATFFEAALKQRPDDIDVLYNLTDTCVALEEWEKAESLLQHCQALDSKKELEQDIEFLRKKLAEGKKTRVLMAAYYFPPLSGSGVFRSLKFAKYLPQFGWLPTVISAEQPPVDWNYSDSGLSEEIPDDVNVIRVPDRVRTKQETSMKSERVHDIFSMLQSVLCHSAQASQLFHQMLQTQDGTVEMLLFPCAALSWVYDTIQYIEKNLDLSQFQAIYTTSGPNSAHLIGFYLKQKYGIPWVADYRDPWTFNPYDIEYNSSVLRQKLLLELETVLLRYADCNLTIEDGFVEDYIKYFDLDRHKIKSIANGYDEEDFSGLEAVKSAGSQFVINYSGLLYTQQRSIEPILNAIKQLQNEKKIDLAKIRLRIVGKGDQSNFDAVVKYDLKRIIQYTGYVSHREAIQSNMDANILLLLVGDDIKFKSVYTGKIFEYLRSGRPILALAPKDGVVDRTLRESGHGEAFLSTQIPEIKAMILREYKKWLNGTEQQILHSPVIERFERKNLTKQLADVLSEVVNNSNPLLVSSRGVPINRDTIIRANAKKSRTELERIADLFLKENYNYIWLKAMIEKATKIAGPNAALVTGSSYGLNGIIERSWNQAVNCSASSQDLYYDFQCAYSAIAKGKAGRFSRCFIVDGYYAACHDLSSGRQERERMISNVYYPIFKDGHNWGDATSVDLWADTSDLSEMEKQYCEQLAVEKMLSRGTYFSEEKRRGGTVFDLNGKNWWDITAEERQALGKIRAVSHNKLFRNTAAIEENKRILDDYTHFLRMSGIMPVFVIAPFTAEYEQYISKEMKESVSEMLAAVHEKIHFVDFNQFSCFETADFVDTDHLSRKGAEKFSRLLAELFR